MKRHPRTAVLLANGPAMLDGLRIGGYTKLLLPIANRPLVEYQASVLASAGVSRIVICMSDEAAESAHVIQERLSRFPLRLECVMQDVPRGTGGTLKQVESLIEGEVFWVMGADLLIDADLTKMAAYHNKSRCAATVGVVSEEDPVWRMERVEFDQSNQVKAIHRIHPFHSRRSKLRPVGLYLFDREVLNSIPGEGYFDLKEQLFSSLYSRSVPTKVWEISEYSMAISSLDQYRAANADVLLRRTEFSFLKQWGSVSAEGIGTGEAGEDVRLIGPVSIGQNVTLGRGALVIGPTAIGSGCKIGEGAILNACVLLKNATVGNGAQLFNCIVTEKGRVGETNELRDAFILRGETPGEIAAAPLCSRPSYGYCAGSRIGVMGKSWSERVYLLWKRCFDVLFSSCVLLCLSPFLALIAAAIASDSPGGVFFRQKRCGKHGRAFTMYKFRSMVSNAEDVKREVQRMNEVDGPMFKIIKDPRVTRVGHFLRATNIDELPQFWNILRGDMALVGPRPLSWEEMRFNPRWRDLRITVDQGLIGLWQVQSHCQLNFADWIHYDSDYVHNRSAVLDFKILMKAIGNMLMGVVGLLFRRKEKEELVARA